MASGGMCVVVDVLFDHKVVAIVGKKSVFSKDKRQVSLTFLPPSR